MIRAMTCIAALLALSACGPDGDRYDDEPDFRTTQPDTMYRDYDTTRDTLQRDTLQDTLFRDTIQRRDTTDTNRT